MNIGQRVNVDGLGLGTVVRLDVGNAMALIEWDKHFIYSWVIMREVA